MTSGPERAKQALRPLFEALGTKTVDCGQVPQASMMKLTINLIQIDMLEALAEGVHFAKQGGVELATLFEILQNGPIANDLYALKAKKYLAQDFSPHGSVSGVRDVLRLISETAGRIGADIPVTRATLNLADKAMAQGLSEVDFSALVKIFGV